MLLQTSNFGRSFQTVGNSGIHIGRSANNGNRRNLLDGFDSPIIEPVSQRAFSHPL